MRQLAALLLLTFLYSLGVHGSFDIEDSVFFPIRNSSFYLFQNTSGLYKGSWSNSNTRFLGKHYRYHYTQTIAFGSNDLRYIAEVDKDSGLTVISSDYGVTWKVLEPDAGSTTGISGSSFQRCLLYGMSGTGNWMLASCIRDLNVFNGFYIYTTNFGSKWTISNYTDIINTAAQRVLSDTSGRIVYALDVNRTLIVSLNYGASFTTRVTADPFQSIECDSTGGYLVGIDELKKNFVLSIDHGITWKSLYALSSYYTLYFGDKFVQAAISDSGRKMALLTDSGFLYASNDFGENWELGRAGQMCNNDIDSNSCQVAYGSNDETLLLSFFGRFFISNDNGDNWQIKMGSNCSTGFYGDTCAGYCNANYGEYVISTSNSSSDGSSLSPPTLDDDYYFYFTAYFECFVASDIQYVNYYEYQANEVSSVLEIGLYPSDCLYPFVSYFDIYFHYHPCTERQAVNINAPVKTITGIIVFLACFYASCVLIIKPDNDNSCKHLKLILGTYFFTALPMLNVILNFMILLTSTWSNYALLIIGVVCINLPNLFFFFYLFNENIRCKFWIISMPNHLFFSVYDDWGKIIMTAIWGAPYFIINSIFVLPWFALGCLLWKLEIFCIGRFQEWWMRIWTGDKHYKAVTLDKKVYNMQIASTLFLESIPLLVLQIINTAVANYDQWELVQAALIVSVLFVLFGLYRYLYYLFYKKFEIAQCPMKISVFGCKPIYLIESDKTLYSRTVILPGSRDLYESAASADATQRTHRKRIIFEKRR
jgi:hypothetical protein